MNRGKTIVQLALQKDNVVQQFSGIGNQEKETCTSFEPENLLEGEQEGSSQQNVGAITSTSTGACNLTNVEPEQISSTSHDFGQNMETEPVPSTSFGTVIASRTMTPILDFDSDDSVLDPHYQPEEDVHGLSLCPGRNESQVQAPVMDEIPIKNLRTLKKEKKVKRNLGQSYKTLKGKTIPERKMKELSVCRMKCKERLSHNNRQAIFEEYWALGSHSKRSAYMASLMEIEDKKTMRVRTNDPEKQKFRTITYKYYFLIHGKREPVCRGCLLKVLDESDNFIKTVGLKKRSSTAGTQTDDMRGKNTVPKHKISDEVREEIKNHILSFPSYESHYTRKSTSKKYLPSHLTLQEMYKLYKEGHENPPSIKIYSQEFKKLNLAFKKPRADTCFTCDKFKIKIQCTEDEQAKNILIQEHDQHKMLGDQGYAEKAKDTDLCKQDEHLQVYTFDLQQCLPTPALTSSVAFYKRQLWTYNLTVHNNKTGKSVCYVWYETIAARGANQIASCLFKHLQLYVPSQTKHIIFYSDTCAGQNRNSHVSSMFTWAVQNSQIEMIDHKFMVPGHSHLEVDTDHGIIEKKKKKTKLEIYHPHDWLQLIKSSSPKFETYEMLQADFLDFASLLKGPLVLRYKDADGNQFKWLEKRWLRYEKSFGVIMFKDVLDRDATFKKINMQRRGAQIPEEIPAITNYPLAISIEKKRDLLSLLPLIPNIFHDFYKNLPTQHNIRNTDPDIMEDDLEIDF